MHPAVSPAAPASAAAAPRLVGPTSQTQAIAVPSHDGGLGVGQQPTGHKFAQVGGLQRPKYYVVNDLYRRCLIG